MRKKSRFTLVMMAVLLMFGMLGIQPAKPVQAAFASDLFFSEYIEGTYFNKAIEIFNGTGAPVDLSDYRLELYSNGAASSTASVDLSGTLVAGDVFVVAHPTADPLILAQADLTSISVINFSGDDAFALRKISTDSFADVIGQIGFRPTSGYWGSNPALTAERTLVRKADICAGDINGSDVFDPNSEWLGYPQNTLTYLGSHTSNCVLNEAEALSWLQGNTTLTGTLDALVATFPAVIPAVIVDAPYQINSRMILSDTLPVGSKVTIEISADGLTWYPYVTDVTLPGTSFWVTELFDPDATPADFDANYGGNVEHYRITVNGNPLEINTFLKVESIISKDEFATTTVLVELASIPVTFADDVAPEMVSVTPAKGLVTLAADQSFILKVKASDPNLYELEIDHSFEGTLPEFSVYADALNPWGTPEDQAQFEGAGVTVEYDALLQEWTIDFGEAITNNYFIPNGVTFYMVLIDEAGNTWGSMSPPTGENTFAYTFEVSNTLEPEITSAVTYVYTPVYEYVGAIAFDDPNNIFTATYSPAEFVAGGAMNDLARYLGALYRQNGSTVISIVYDGVTYTWDETGTLKGSNWEDASGKTLVSAMVADYLAAPADLVITVGDGLNTSDVTFELVVTNTLEPEITSAVSYEYDPVYEYVGAIAFDDPNNIFTATYSPAEFLAGGAMNDLARYLGALYRQDGSTVISIVYDGVTYTWDETGTLKGSNWEDASGKTLVSAMVADYLAAPADLVITVGDGLNTSDVTFELVVTNTLEEEIASAPLYLYADGYVYVGDSVFDDPSNTYTNTYSPAEFVAGGAMNDLARYLGALYRQDGSTVISIVYGGVTYTWDPTEPNKGSNWYNGTTSLVSAMVNDYLTTGGDLGITVSDGLNTSDVTFELVVTNTLEEEIASAPLYLYADGYVYVGDSVFDDPSNTYTNTYSPAEFLAEDAMNDLARYLGALYRQDGSTVISIVYDGVTYTWDETGTLKGSNWEDASGKTLVSAMVADYLAAPGDLVITVGDGLNTSDVTFRLLITNTLDDEIESAPGYVYSDYTYVGDYVFVDATNIYTVTYDDVEFNPNAMYDLARYLGALYRQDGSTVISIVYDGVTYTWDETGTLKGSNWEDASGNTLVSVVVAGIGSYDPAVGLVFTVSDGVHTENVTFKFVILDTIAPEVVSGVAKSASDGNVDLVDGAFTVDQGYVVDTIEITLDEDVLVALGTIVTMEGYGPYGTITANVDGVITITPYPGYETAALIGSFTFTVPDGSITDLAGNAFTGSIILNVLNVAPVAMDDAYTTDEDVVLDVPARGVLANDTDFDPTVLTTVKVTDPANGTLVLNADGSFTYTPETDFFGTDTFTYKANDGELDSNIATVTITVTDFKDQVIAVDDEYETDEDTTLTIVAPGVLANDIDVDLNIMTAGLVMNVEHGTLTLNGDGSFTYDPDPDFYGTDSFEYQLVTYPAVQSLWTDEATVTITVNPVGDAPVLGLIEDATIPELVEFSFTATATDVDLPAQVLTFSLVGAPDGAAIDAATGVFTWIPTEEQGPGVYTFTVKVCDDTAPIPLCDEQEVTLTVTEVNTAPVAQDLFETTLEDIPVDVTLVATDAEDDVLTYAIVDQPAHGTVTLVGTTATYTPELDFNGVDSFTYKANDGLEDSAMAVVTITVTPVNDAPVAVDDQYVTDEDVMLTVAAPGILENDSDVEGDEMTIIPVDDVSNGTLEWTLNGGFIYTPDAKFNGTDTFSYMLFDGDAYSNTAVVTITVNPVNDWPLANDDFYEVMTGTDLVKDAAEGILANDVLLDPDEEVSVQILDEPQHGTLSMNDDGSFNYTPDAGYMGTDTFRYLVLSVRTINAEWSDDATVTITVQPYMRLFLPIILR